MQMVVAVEPVLSEPDLSNPAALTAIMAALAEKYPTESFSTSTDIFGTGLADSQTFLDILLAVEEQTGTRFDAGMLDFEGEVTPQRMAQAFKVP